MTGPAVTVVPGDHTGPEVTRAVIGVVDALGLGIEWEERPATNGEVTDELVASAKRTGAVLMAYQKGRRDEGVLAPIVTLRERLGVYANVRPLHNLPLIPTRHENVDLIVVRETTEGVYRHLEHESIPGVFESFKVTTRHHCERIARFAFEYARRYGRKRVTIVHKANILKQADGLFLRTCLEVAEGYPDIAADECIVDALCMKLVLNPGQFDILLCGNLFGDIVADIAAGLAGGPSNCPSLNFAPDNVGIFAAPHGDPPDALGNGRANPLSLLLPAVSLLRHLEQVDAADRLMLATNDTLRDGVLPIAAGGDATCEAFAGAVAGRL